MNIEDIIKNAYGERWADVKDLIDKKGWCQNWATKSYRDLGFPDWQIELKQPMHWRPISLSGLETNNGWTKITCVEDLPKVYDEYWWIHKENGICREVFTKDQSEWKNILQIKFMTHWKILDRPKLPLF